VERLQHLAKSDKTKSRADSLTWLGAPTCQVEKEDSDRFRIRLRNRSGAICAFGGERKARIGAFGVTGKKATRMNGRLAASLAAGALVLAGLPTAGFALGVLDDGVSLAANGNFAALTPARIDPKLARFVAERSSGASRPMRFTPAGIAARPSRSVTVAVRIDSEAARAISVRSAIASAREQSFGDSPLRIAPTRYNLGISRGYQNFAKATPAPTLSRSLSEAGIPDLADFRPTAGAKPDESRFAARIAVEEEAKAGAAPRTIDSRGDQALDVAGSYRLTRNLDVTAGVRYSQERDRLAPLADPAKQDNQAVYVGTQFRF
jgi:hypothetical protein